MKIIGSYMNGLALYQSDDHRIVKDPRKGVPAPSEKIIEKAKRLKGGKVMAPNGHMASRWQGVDSGKVYLVFRDSSAIAVSA